MKKAIVIGAGFGGIAAAIRLRKKGYYVEIIDRCNNLGGRAQTLNLNGFKHDTGPTLITAPFLLKELFQLFNKDINSYLKLVPIKTSALEKLTLLHKIIKQFKQYNKFVFIDLYQ